MIGTAVSHYRILEKLGEGGMGVVYKAEDTKLERLVALKFLPPAASSSPQDKERFAREAKAAAALNHPNICSILDIQEHTDPGGDLRMFIVMEFVQGTTLRERAGSLNEKESIAVARYIADGLAAAHTEGIIHRDIKSSNIMITRDDRVKIMDFGLAKVHGRPDLTAVGTTVGTLAYMSPEQARGEAVDERTDIYSFGVVLFELLTGKRPFEGKYEHAMLYAILNQDPPRVSSLREEISQGLATVVDRCLQKDPGRRYQSFADVQAALEVVKAGRLQETNHRKIFHFRLSKKQTAVLVGGFLLLLIPAIIVSGTWDQIADFLGLAQIPDQKHLVVLPLTNVGNDASRQTFCDGLMESMTSQLTQLQQFHGAFWVVPAREVRRNDIASPSEALKTFGANLVVDGSLQVIENRYRLTLNLVDTRNLRQLNSSVIDIERSDVASLHDESVIRLFTMLHLELEPQSRFLLQAGGTRSPAAYELYLQGRGALLRYEQSENINAAIAFFQRAVKADSLYALAYAALGEAYWRKFESEKSTRWVEEALKNCEKAKVLDGRLTPVNVTLGIVYTGTGHYDEALASFEKAIQNDPSSAEAFRGLARTHEARGQMREAEQTYRQAILLKPDYWAGYNDLGVFFYRNNRYEEAIHQFQKVMELTPDNYRGYNNLGGIYYLLERWGDARSMFEQSFSIRKTYQVASNLGTLYYVEGRFAEAARMYEEALVFNKTDYLVWGNLATAYYWAPRERDKALDALRKSILLAEERRQVNPRDAELVSQIAGYHAMLGDTKQARTLLKKSLEMDSTNSFVMFRAGTTYEHLDDRDRALYWIQKALAAGYSRSEIGNQPELRNLYDDPRYKKLFTADPQ